MRCAGQMLRRIESALDERLVDHDFGGDVGQFTFLSGFHLLSHRREVSLHAIHTHRDAVDERKRL